MTSAVGLTIGQIWSIEWLSGMCQVATSAQQADCSKRSGSVHSAQADCLGCMHGRLDMSDTYAACVADQAGLYIMVSSCTRSSYERCARSDSHIWDTPGDISRVTAVLQQAPAPPDQIRDAAVLLRHQKRVLSRLPERGRPSVHWTAWTRNAAWRTADARTQVCMWGWQCWAE